jgi:hypothetical protein
VARRTVSDSDACTGTEGLVKLHQGKNHTPHHPTPPPVPHPEPRPRARNQYVPTGMVNRAH